MRKVILNWATGPHIAFTDITAPLTEAYAARHGFDVIRNTGTPESTPVADRQRLFARPALRAAAAVMNRQPVVARWLSRALRRPVERTPIDRSVDWLVGCIAATAGPDEPPAWEKLRKLHDVLPNYDIVVWLDADAVIVDHERDISGELDPDEWLGLVEHRFAGRAPDHFNSGVMVFRSCPESRAFLRQALSLRGLRFHRWWDQAAILYLLGFAMRRVQHERETAAYRALTHLPLAWNSIPGATADRPRIKHYAGINNAERLESLRADVRRFMDGETPLPTTANVQTTM